MASQILEFALAGAFAFGFVAAAVCDWRTRTIPHAITVPMALLAPLYWYAQGYVVWPDMVIAFGAAFVIFLLFAFWFAINQMGGGDLKLISAASLWFPLQQLTTFIWWMAVLGAVFTTINWAQHRWRKRPGPVWTPYGLAISFAGLWAIYERYFNQFG